MEFTWLKNLWFWEVKPKCFILLTAYLLIGLVGFIDFLSGIEISFSIFYLIPVTIASWYVGRNAGIGVSFACAATWHLSNQWDGGLFSSWIIPYWNTSIRLLFFLLISVFLGWQKDRLKEQNLARIDFLTEAFNRRAFYEISSLELARANRYNRFLTLAYIDLDDFKSANDRYGHLGGDKILRRIVETIKKNIRINDTLARMGGDEFALLLPESDSVSAKVILNKIQKQVNQEMKENGWPISMSVGVLTYSKPPTNVDEVLREVDDLMYSVKEKGKNKIAYKVK